MISFRYKECYDELCGPSESLPPNADVRNLVWGQIGHMHRREPSRGLDLEKYVDDHRRYDNEKYRSQDECSLGNELNPRTQLQPPRIPHPPLIRFHF